MQKKSGLGRGLDAIFSDNTADTSGASVLRISQIEPNKEQPRKKFDTNALEDLCESIKIHGVLQPLVVRPLGNDKYQLVAGERRWRASRMAELTEVPVVIKNLSDIEAMEISLIENLQREDLDPIEEALGYEKLMSTFDLTQEEAAKKVGRSRPAIANSLRLLSLPENIRQMVSDGKISASNARTLLSVPEDQTENALKMILSGATVRQIENITKPTNKKSNNRQRPIIFDEAEVSLTELLGRPVTIKQKSKGGTITIDFYSVEDLKEFANTLEK